MVYVIVIELAVSCALAWVYDSTIFRPRAQWTRLWQMVRGLIVEEFLDFGVFVMSGLV